MPMIKDRSGSPPRNETTTSWPSIGRSGDDEAAWAVLYRVNTVRAGMVGHPADYPWSGYRMNVQEENGELITHREFYQGLGADDSAQQSAYRELFRYELEPRFVDEIRKATTSNFVLSGYRCADQVAKILGR